jgi:hypothetical protein
MPKCTIALILAALAVFVAVPACRAAPDDAWEEDLRRCMIYKPVHGGRVVIANNEGVLEIDVQRDGDATAGTDTRTFMIAFDDRTPIDTTPPKNAEAGIYDHRFGTYAAIAAVFAKTRNMTISIAVPDKPSETLTVPIGNGAKAMAFLKKCDDYWRHRNKRR